MGDIGTFAKAFAGGFIGKLAGALFIAMCLFLGFGPDEWAKFIVTGFPIWVTPVVAQAVFLTLAALTSGALIWSFLNTRNVSQQPAAETTRRALIAEARDFVSKTIRQNPDSDHFERQLASDPIFYRLRPYFSDHFKMTLSGRMVSYPSWEDTRMPVIAARFIDEIERLEKEWNLT